MRRPAPRALAREGVARALAALPDAAVRELVRLWGERVLATRAPRETLRTLFPIVDDLASLVDRAATPYDGGSHVKHRLMRYHDFFVERVEQGERVLDIGCGHGQLAADIAERAGAEVTGIDFNADRLGYAVRERSGSARFVQADALTWEPDGRYDVVVLSNVLEHIEPRVELLRRYAELAAPSRFLVRVPMSNRDWTVPLREELGLPHMGDDTHEVEYTEESFRSEMRDAGLEVTQLRVNWGEIWAELRQVR